MPSRSFSFDSGPLRRNSEEYMLLEPNSGSPARSTYSLSSGPWSSRFCFRSSRRRHCLPHLRHYGMIAALLIVVVLVLSVATLSLAAFLNGLPPLYTQIRQFENDISVKNTPIGSMQRFIRFPGHYTGLGMNNYLQEIYFMAHLAYLSNRTFVYDDYVWSHNPTPYTLKGFSIIPSRLPLHAIVSGSESGDLPQKSTNTESNTPKAISAQWYEEVCSPAERVLINPPDAPVSGDGAELVGFWTDLLGKMSERCVEVDKRRQPIFHYDLFASSRLLSAWPSMHDSPVLTGRSWSPIILGALSRNLPLVVSPSSSHSNGTIPHLLAMHVRRGDFKGHCKYLARDEKEYGWINQHRQLPDRFSPEDVVPSKRESYYMEHCWVEVDKIVRKARELHDLSQSNANGALRSVYIMTNGDNAWISKVKHALLEDGWEDVITTKDLMLDRWERYLDGAVDMAIAERAGLFVGNGFSSLTSNVVMFRMIAGQPIESNRFW